MSHGSPQTVLISGQDNRLCCDYLSSREYAVIKAAGAPMRRLDA